MYAADLTQLTGPWYFTTHEKPAFLVGWLGAGYDYTQGRFPPDLIPALLRLAHERRNTMRGYHCCEFCADDETADAALQFAHAGMIYYLGDAEIHVDSPDGSRRYVAPTLIVHYILHHNYLPPPEFVEAIRHRSS